MEYILANLPVSAIFRNFCKYDTAGPVDPTFRPPAGSAGFLGTGFAAGLATAGAATGSAFLAAITASTTAVPASSCVGAGATGST